MSYNFFEVLNLRTEYEDIVYNFDIPESVKSSDINSIKWFIKKGNQKNRFREGYNRAIEISEMILSYKKG